MAFQARWSASKAIHQPPDLDARVAKIQKQAKPQSCRLQIIHTLGGMDPLQRPSNVQFNQDGILNQQIGGKTPDHPSFVMDRDIKLLPNLQSRIPQSERKTVLLDVLGEPGTKPIGNRECRPNDRFGQPVTVPFISVHPR
jgi:hypothetical protein